MPKKDSIKRAAKRAQRRIGYLLNDEDDPSKRYELKSTYGDLKYIERELDYMEEEIHTHHIRNSEFPDDMIGRPDDDFDD